MPKPAIRAKDLDRERTLEVLHQAFVDGQLDALEHQCRTDLVLQAVYLPELESAVRDLQTDPQPQDEDEVSGFNPWVALVVVVGLLVAGWFGVNAIIDADREQPPIVASDGDVVGVELPMSEEESPYVEWQDVHSDLPGRGDPANPTLTEVTPWHLAVGPVTEVVESYPDVTGTPYVAALAMTGDGVEFDRPLGGDAAAIETWRLGSSAPDFTITPPTDKRDDLQLVDVRTIDLAALETNVDFALTDVGVANAELLSVDLTFVRGTPQLQISVHDPHRPQNTGYVHTTLSGTVQMHGSTDQY